MVTTDNETPDNEHSAGTLPLRIGTRGSALALAQATLVADLLRERGFASDVRIIRTQGDRDQMTPLTVIGGQGVFTSALQDALANDEIDLAVHSAKDLPSTESPGLELAAFLSRQDARDIVVTHRGVPLDDLPAGSRVGTSSRRRIAALKAVRPDLVAVEIRGNIDTRIRKATEGELDAVILAAAGLLRMGWQERITAYLPLDVFVPAPGQAALAIEVRRGDARTATAVAQLNDPAVALALRTERAVLRALGAGCVNPIGAHATVVGHAVHLRVMEASSDLEEIVTREVTLDRDTAEIDAARVAVETMAEVRLRRQARRATGFGPGIAGRAILLTRPRGDNEALARMIEDAGGTPLIAPMLEVTHLDATDDRETLRELTDGSFSWVVVVSPNAASGLELTLRSSRATIPASVRMAAIGEGTASRLRSAGLRVDLVPERHDAQGMAAALRESGVEAERVLIVGGNLRRPELAERLIASGATVTTLDTYHVERVTAIDPDVRTALLQGDVDIITAASPSAISALSAVPGLAGSLVDIPVVCIGETTETRAQDEGWTVAAVARDPSPAGLFSAIIDALATTASPSQTEQDIRA